MGSDSSNPNYERVAALQEEQINLNKAELESKKQNLYKTRLDILKSHGAQHWSPERGGMNAYHATESHTSPVSNFGLQDSVVERAANRASKFRRQV
jgi:hypothetical protein